MNYDPVWYTSDDGLTLFARDYPGNRDRPPLLCMPGLTRNSADFEGLLNRLDGEHAALAVDLRGRGLSDRDPQPGRYQVPMYAEDMFHLLDTRQTGDVVLVGTSLGGLIAMQMLAMRPQHIRALILNDIGAEIEAAGLARIQSSIAGMPDLDSWEQAEAFVRDSNLEAFPDFTDHDWRRFARRLFREDPEGRLHPDWDPTIVPPRPVGPDNLDLWALFRSLPDIPVLVIRGSLSDILSRDCAEKMAALKRHTQFAEIPERGHAPLLDEPTAVAAIRQFLADIQ